jgi:hypothetical protein
MAATDGLAEVKYRFTPQVAAYLDQLLATGLYGRNRTAAVEMLVRDQIVLLLEKNQLRRAED